MWTAEPLNDWSSRVCEPISDPAFKKPAGIGTDVHNISRTNEKIP